MHCKVNLHLGTTSSRYVEVTVPPSEHRETISKPRNASLSTYKRNIPDEPEEVSSQNSSSFRLNVLFHHFILLPPFPVLSLFLNLKALILTLIFLSFHFLSFIFYLFLGWLKQTGKLGSLASRRCFPREGVIVRGTPLTSRHSSDNFANSLGTRP